MVPAWLEVTTGGVVLLLVGLAALAGAFYWEQVRNARTLTLSEGDGFASFAIVAVFAGLSLIVASVVYGTL